MVSGLASDYPQFLEFVAQGFSGDFELAGGLGLIEVVAGKRLADDFFLVLPQRFVEGLRNVLIVQQRLGFFELGEQVFGQNAASDHFHVWRAERHQAFDKIFQFANIAGPRSNAHKVDQFFMEGMGLFVLLGSESFQKMVSENRHILLALLQGWHGDRINVQAVVQVFAEFSCFDQLANRSTTSRDHTHIDFAHAVAADWAKFAFLQRPHELGLHIDGQAGDFVHEKRAAVGLGKQTLAIGGRAGEGALDVPEQFAFDQIGRNGATVDGHKRLVAARAEHVDGASQFLFASAALAFQQHTHITARRRFDGLQ